MRKTLYLLISLLFVTTAVEENYGYTIDWPVVDPYEILSPKALCDSIESIVTTLDKFADRKENPSDTTVFGIYDGTKHGIVKYLVPDSVPRKDIIHVKDPLTLYILGFMSHIADVPISTNPDGSYPPPEYLLRSDARKLCDFYKNIKYDCRDIFTFWLDYRIGDQYSDIASKDTVNFYAPDAAKPFFQKDVIKALKEMPDTYYSRNSILGEYSDKKYQELKGILRLLPKPEKKNED